MDNTNIPKIIHYCWFGNKKKPNKVVKCINSWKTILKDYQLIEWNENNFDIHQNKYVEKAYSKKKYAFVSDVARLQALKKYGGIYLDTDVEVLKSFDVFLDKKFILGFEEKNFVATSFIASVKNHFLINEFIFLYENESFYNDDDSLNIKTNVVRLTNLLQEKGLLMNDKYQILENEIEIFPKEYFSPYDYINCVYGITEKTYCIHHFYVSWKSGSTQFKKIAKKFIVNIIGKKNMNSIRNKLKY